MSNPSRSCAPHWHSSASDFYFTIEFTDLHGKPHMIRTGQIKSDPVLPATGDHVAIYYASDHPSNLTDVRFGPPGNGFLAIATPFVARLVRIVRTRFRARRRRKLIAWPLDQK